MLGSAVGVNGEQYYPNLYMNAYIVQHKPGGWNEDDPLTTGMVAKVVVQSNSDGVVPLTQAWLANVSGEYDVIIDYDNDGLFSWTLDGLAGFRVSALAKVNARVWDDKNLDGLMGVGEPGLPNVPVQLFQVTSAYPDGQLVAETMTDASGDYLFDNLAPGDYYVVSGKPDPDWWKFTRKDVGQPGSDDIDNDSDADTETDPNPGRTHTFTLDPGEVETWVDVGLYKLGTIGDVVWHDYYIGGDGIQNDNLGGFPNRPVTLVSVPSGYGAAATTGAGGAYLFEKVELVDAN